MHAGVVATAIPCPYPLKPTQAEILVEPPLLTQTLSGTLGDTVDLNLTVPQTVPGRWGVRAAFQNPDTYGPTPVALAFVELPCKFESISHLPLPYLIQYAQPYITEAPYQYNMRFLIHVSLNESFTLAGHTYTRQYEASVGFEIVLFRTLDVSSVISTLDATLVWGYIQKFSVFVPLDRSSPTVEFDLITVAAEADYQIDPATMAISGVEGHIQSIATLAYVGLVNSAYNKQRWHLKAVIDQYSICSTSIADAFSLAFTLKSSTPESATHATGLRGTLEGMENWCMLNTTVRLNGIQTTHADASTPDETIRFFLGDWVHVRDHVYTDLALIRTDIVSVVLEGDALTGPSPVTMYDSGTSLFGFAIETCPAATDPTWVCYKFLLDSTNFRVDEDLTITTTLSVVLDESTVLRRVVRRNAQSAKFSNTVGVARTAQQQQAAATAPLLAGVALLAAVLCAI
eukprot:m51a1_g10805 hypothetical protein (458) ;mRNA; r:32697-34070